MKVFLQQPDGSRDQRPPIPSIFKRIYHAPTESTLLFGTLEKNQEIIEDLPNAMNAAEITDKLGLHSLRQQHWYIQSTCATSPHARNEDLMPATTWIVECSSIYAMSIPTVDVYVAVLAGASIRDQRVCYNISSSTTCSRLKLLVSDS